MATVLVVEDRADDRRLLESVLTHRGHQVLEASSGATALAMARRAQPDLIITDLVLPMVDGYELVRRLRRDPSTARIRIMLYSAHYNEDEMNQFARKHQVQMVVTKPTRPDVFVEYVDSLLNLAPPTWGPADNDSVEHVRLVSNKLVEKIQELEVANRDVRRLLAASVQTQERERARIARDIHDDALQVLTAALIRAGSLGLTMENPEHRVASAELESALQLAISRLRRLLLDLRPPALEAGLRHAVQDSLAAAFDGTATSFVVTDATTTEADPDDALLAFRILQEAITNASRHAKATSVAVELSTHDRGLLATVVDDGVGFDGVAESASTPQEVHLGLISMRERAHLAEGWLKVTSVVGLGTTVRLWLPVAEASDD